MIDYNFVPEKCASCIYAKQIYYNRFICGMPVSKELEIIDISAFEIDPNKRPEWCPLVKLADDFNDMPEEKRMLFIKAINGLRAMFELMGASLEFRRKR